LEVGMAGVEAKSMDAPDEVRTPDKTRVDVVTVGTSEVGRFTFQPGRRWSECIKPIVGTDSCQAEHLGYAIAGRMHVQHEDGTTMEIGPGDAYVIAPGHDAWVLGDEEFVGVEFKSAAEYAKG
jgi:quercetin dioxygenase-like cupin family protein